MENIKQELKALLKKAKYIVYTNMSHVSNSGMLRHINCYVIVNNEPKNINWYIEKLGLYKRAKNYNDKNAESLRVSGCGMDMGFDVVYNLSSVVFKDNFKCRGENCPANDHTNDRPPYKWDRKKSIGKLHSDVGYCLIQKWL